jgi:spiro-SPASM protein
MDGASCLELLGRRLAGVPGVERLLVLSAPASSDRSAAIATGLAAGLGATPVPETLSLADGQAATAFRALKEAVDPESVILFCQADTPLLSPAVSATLLENHTKWHAEYSFADGYPLGFTPEVIKPSILGILATLAESKSQSLAAHDALFETIRQDINAFEIETDIAPLDLRLLRIDLHCDSRQNLELCRRLLPVFDRSGGDSATFLAELQGNQAPLRTLPSWFNVQICGRCPQVCPVCPWGRRGEAILGDPACLPAADFLALGRRIRDFAPESIVSVSLWGDPACHPEIWEIIEGFRGLAPLRLYIETAGIGWDAARLEAFAVSGGNGHVTWIISLDSNDPAAYAAMRGQGWQEALAAAHLFARLFPESAYIQAVRCRDNEESLQAHYQYWKKLGARQIIQKYDHFSMRLDDRRLSDISPIDRQACWHLKRDMAILLDGTVPLCRQDLAAMPGEALQFTAGNAFTEDLATIWARLDVPYRSQLAGEYPGICGNCDEYYTYNH